jgi:hypothetical protein
MDSYKYKKYKNKYEVAKKIINKYKQIGGEYKGIFINDNNLEKLQMVLNDENDKTNSLLIISFTLDKSEKELIEYYQKQTDKNIELKQIEKNENEDEMVNILYQIISKEYEMTDYYLIVIQGYATNIEKN